MWCVDLVAACFVHSSSSADKKKDAEARRVRGGVVVVGVLRVFSTVYPLRNDPTPTQL